jgi:hypothetical protein
MAAGVAIAAVAVLTYQRLRPTAEAPVPRVQPVVRRVDPASPPPAPTLAVATPAPATAPVPATTATTPAPARPPRPVVMMPAPLPPGTPGPTIESDGTETTAVVPLLGSTEGMAHYSLARRRGLVVNLPHAAAAIPNGLHAVNRDGLRYVWIRDRAEGGVHVRFIFANPPPDERLLELEDDAIRVRIRLKAPVAAEDPAQSVVADGESQEP